MTKILGSSKLLLGLLLSLLILVSGLNPARALSAETSSAYLWSVKTVEKSQGGYSFSLKLDSSGGPHLAFGEGRLYYASSQGGNWSTQIVDDTPGSGNNISLALDSSGGAHIAYEADSLGPTGLLASIRYASWNGSQWVIQTIGASAPALGFAMALGVSDRPRIVYTDASQVVKYAAWTGTQWSIQTIETPGPCQRMPPSLVISSNDTPHISYGYGCDGELHYATLVNNAWHIQTLDTGLSYDNVSISLDGSGRPHIAYHASDGIRYLFWNGTQWSSPQVVGQGSGPSLVIDSLDRPHISYADNIASQGITEAAFNGSTWVSQTIPGTSASCAAPQQALDSDEHTHIVYNTCSPSGPLFDFYYVHEGTTPGSWSTPQLIQSSTRPSWSTSIAVDQNNHPHISYLDSYQRTLRYAAWDGSQWTSQVVDNGVDLHAYSSIQVDHNNVPHIAYFGVGGLKYASPDGSGGWTRELLGTGGAYASLALDPVSDAPRIAFCGAGLEYAAWNGSGWNIESVDSVCGGSDIGGETSLALDSNGDPHIAYSESGPTPIPTLYIARQGGVWSTRSVVAADGLAGRALALDSSGVPHIVFCGGSHILPQNATWNGSSWDVTTIENPHPAASLTCETIYLAIDKNDVAHVSYMDNYGDGVRYVVGKGGVWTGEVVEPDVNAVAEYSPVAVGPNGLPWIAYADLLSGDMQAAVQVPAVIVSGSARVPGGTIRYTDGTPKTVATDASGRYSFVVPSGWSGPVTPSKPGCTFTPVDRTYAAIATDQIGQNYSAHCTEFYKSVATQDGYVVESSGNSGKGGDTNATDPFMRIGQLYSNLQMRSILSFNTADLPDNAVLTSVQLKFKKDRTYGGNPFLTHGNLLIDVRKGAWSGNSALQTADFQARADKTAALTFTNTLVNGWYSKALARSNFIYVNKVGVTQFRLRFALDPNGQAQQLVIYSGSAPAASRPLLVITYYAP